MGGTLAISNCCILF